MRPATILALARATATLALLRAADDPPGPREAGADEPNTYGLPDGEDLADELRRWFARQARAVLGTLPTIGTERPATLPALTDWDDPMAAAMTPIVGAYWQDSGERTRERIGLDPEEWRVSNPHLQRMIHQQCFEFCASTNRTTSLQLEDAHRRLREELASGLVDHGERIPQLTRRVQAVFQHASRSRARRIAQTEASRAVHAAQLEAARQSGIVVGLEWLLSGDACPVCQAIARDVGRVRLGQGFATIGTNPVYRTIRHPPAHPGCRCSLIEILSSDYGGPTDVAWGAPLRRAA